MTLQMAAQSTQGMIPFTGWSTPCVVEPSTTTPRPSWVATGRNTDYLGRQVHQVEGIVGWPTPQARDYKDRGENLDLAKRETKNQSLGVKARQVTDLWPTPVADGDRTTNYKQGGTSLGYAARSISETSGTDTTSPSAPRSMGQLGQGALNPELCRWLQGYPIGWGLSEDTETP